MADTHHGGRIAAGRLVRRWPVRMAVLLWLVAPGAPMAAQGAPSATDDSLPAPYRAEASAMSTARFARSWTLAPGAFRRDWDNAYAADRAALGRWRDSLSASAAERETARLRYRYLWGRVAWPFFHWRESAATAVRVDVEAVESAARASQADARWWSMREHRELVGALVHERARTLLRTTPSLRRGDAQWLRAEFLAAGQLFRDSALVRQVTTGLLLTHLDDNDERGIDSVRTRWLALRPDVAAQARLDSLVRAAKAVRDGHRAVVYRTRAGVPLELHLLRPLSSDSVGARPAMLWFHGGSGTTGSWSHSPGVVRMLRQQGVTVIAVEFGTGSRFDTGPLEQLDDARAAYRYVRAHATALGVDSTRLGVAGFSSGAGLALTLGTRGVTDRTPAPPPTARVYPAAVIVTGACVDPAGPREDGYFRKMVQRAGSPRDVSPVHLLAKGQPPTLIVQATKDEYCAYEDAQRFVNESRALGNEATLETIEGATHFFGFYFRPGQEQMRTAINAALFRWGWNGPR